MLRINLLPAYIAERKKTRNAIIGASALVLAVLGGGLAYHFGVYEPSVQDLEQRATAEEQAAAAVTALNAETKTIRDSVLPIQAKNEFVKAVQFANVVRQRIYRNAARYTYRTVEYNQMDVTGNTLSVSGAVKSVGDLGRFYITMFGNPDVTAVSIQGIPSYPNNQPTYNVNDPNSPSPTQGTWFPVQLTATLVEPVITPQLPPTVNAGDAGAAGGGFGGGSYGPPGGGGSGRPSSYGPPSGYGPPGGGGSSRPTGSGGQAAAEQ